LGPTLGFWIKWALSLISLWRYWDKRRSKSWGIYFF